MPWDSNAAVKSSVKGLKNYSEEQVSRFRSAANNAYASCKKKKKGNCDSYAIAVGWTALKKKSKQEDGTPPEDDELLLALLEYFMTTDEPKEPPS